MKVQHLGEEASQQCGSLLGRGVEEVTNVLLDIAGVAWTLNRHRSLPVAVRSPNRSGHRPIGV